jgi:type I restriction enzyme S subunit
MMGVEFAPGASGAPACKWKPYPDYKDSGVEWVGKIPAHWDIKKLRRIFRVINGSTPKSGVLDYWDGDIVWVTPDDLGQLKSDTINMSARRITELGYQSCGTTLVPYGSLVLSTRAPIGHLAIAGIDLCTNQGCKIVVFKSNDDTRFFYYQLLTTRSELKSWGQGSTFKELGKDKLKAIELVSPTISEQRSIASFLDRKTAHIDILVSKKERLITLLQEKRAALISHTVTKGLDPDVPMKDSGVEWLGEIPAHWDETITSALFMENKRKNKGTQETNLLSLSYGNIVRKDINSNEGLLPETFKAYQIVYPRHIILRLTDLQNDKRSLRVGHVNEKGIITSAYTSLVKKSNAVESSQYFYYLLHTYDLKKVFYGLGGGVRQSLNFNELKKLRLLSPPSVEQTAIANFINSKTTQIDSLISKIQEAIKTLQEYRTALISAAVTGKIDVSNEKHN